MNKKILHLEGIAGFAPLSRAYIQYRAEADLRGHSDDTEYGPDPTSSALYIMGRQNNVAAFMIYYKTACNCYQIHLAWTSEVYREMGLYKALWAEIKDRARQDGVYKIRSGTHVDNKTMQKVYEKQGRKARYIHYEIDV